MMPPSVFKKILKNLIINIHDMGYIQWMKVNMGATQKSWRIYFQFVVPPLGGLS